MRPVYPVTNNGQTSLMSPGMFPPAVNDAPPSRAAASTRSKSGEPGR